MNLCASTTLNQMSFLSFTADILLSFSEHPPLSIPTSGFVFDMVRGPDDERLYKFLAKVRKSCGRGNLTLKYIVRKRCTHIYVVREVRLLSHEY